MPRRNHLRRLALCAAAAFVLSPLAQAAAPSTESSQTYDKLVDAVVGIEYDACCWIGRVVFERLQSTTVTATKRVLFQIEFVGFARVGSNPLSTLKQNVPRYQYLRETVETPSRFSNYE